MFVRNKLSHGVNVSVGQSSSVQYTLVQSVFVEKISFEKGASFQGTLVPCPSFGEFFIFHVVETLCTVIGSLSREMP